MECLGPSDIERYITGNMDERVIAEITHHLDSCRRCRLAVNQARRRTIDESRHTPAESSNSIAAKTMLKIQCTTCNARYGIPEDRVKGRVLKIRCKNCQTIIEVHGSEKEKKSVLERSRKIWFVAINRKHVGPFTEDEIKAKFERGEIKKKTYIWQQGFPRWERLANLPEFKDLKDEPAVIVEPSAETAPLLVERGGLGGANKIAQSSNANFADDLQDDKAFETIAEEPPIRDSFSPEELETELLFRNVDQSPRETENVASDLERRKFPEFHRSEEEASTYLLTASETPEETDNENEDDAEDDDGSSESYERYLKGQRNENSVLFSLTHLRKLALPPPPKIKAPENQPDLFDIRPLATPPPPIVLPPQESPTHRKKFMSLLGIGIVGILIGACGLLVGLYFAQPNTIRSLLASNAEKVSKAISSDNQNQGRNDEFQRSTKGSNPPSPTAEQLSGNAQALKASTAQGAGGTAALEEKVKDRPSKLLDNISKADAGSLSSAKVSQPLAGSKVITIDTRAENRAPPVKKRFTPKKIVRPKAVPSTTANNSEEGVTEEPKPVSSPLPTDGGVRGKKKSITNRELDAGHKREVDSVKEKVDTPSESKGAPSKNKTIKSPTEENPKAAPVNRPIEQDEKETPKADEEKTTATQKENSKQVNQVNQASDKNKTKAGKVKEGQSNKMEESVEDNN